MHDQEGDNSNRWPDKDRQDTSEVSGELGPYLKSIRVDRGMTLRGVEEATGKVVSNPYLSQIEQGKIKKPDPNILHKLSEVYGVSYENLMVRAGYIISSGTRDDRDRHGRVATFAEHALTKEEEQELLDYLQFMRNRKKNNGQT